MNFETDDDAIRWRKVHKRKLRSGNKRQLHVAGALNRCRKNNRCELESCRVCMREFRIEWIGEATKVFTQRPHWTRCSIITDGLLVAYGQLGQFDLNGAIKKIRKRLERSAIHDRVVLGGLDVSLNIENNQLVGWQFHLYLLVEGRDDNVLHQAIKTAFPPEQTALVPYDFAEVANPLEALSYAYKAVVERRYGFIHKGGNHQTSHQPLKGADLRELLPFLANHNVGARLILRGVRRNGRRLIFTPMKSSSGSGKN